LSRKELVDYFGIFLASHVEYEIFKNLGQGWMNIAGLWKTGWKIFHAPPDVLRGAKARILFGRSKWHG
jgi:hypothetical protein